MGRRGLGSVGSGGRGGQRVLGEFPGRAFGIRFHWFKLDLIRFDISRMGSTYEYEGFGFSFVFSFTRSTEIYQLILFL